MPPKSGHQRAKNIDYDEDDIYGDDDYYEEDGYEMTDQDREQMRIGTIKVKEALGSSLMVSDAQVQDALWDNYYDVGKSVADLKKKLKPAQPKLAPKAQPPRTSSRFDQAANAVKLDIKGKQTQSHSPLFMVQELSCTAPILASSVLSHQDDPMPLQLRTNASKGCADYPLSSPVTMTHHYDSFSVKDFFCDTPWCNVPPHRVGRILVEPCFPKGGLLGGSSKTSKLAALAAARKKKQEEEKAMAASLNKLSETQTEADAAVALLDRLSVKEKDGVSNAGLRGGGEISEPRLSLSRYPIRKKSSTPPPVPIELKVEIPSEPLKVVETPTLRTGPSAFASVLCGIGSTTSERRTIGPSRFPIPYTNFPGFANAKPFAKPSPDDVVIRAQAKGAKPKPAQSKKANEEKLAQSIDKLAMDESPKLKSKNLNVMEEFERSGMKRMANFIVIGHVDHGKSTLMGRLLYDLKVIDQRSVDKLRKEAETIGKSSFALAWVMDQTSEERSRGITVDIATNHFETDKTRFTILDAPGHKDFIPNMIAGASQADFAILVIDASTNSFESGLKGQTKEHALLVRSMGVQRLVVAVNKMDTVSWSHDRFEEISQQMTAFLTTANFSEKSITFIPCAGLTGENVAQKVEDTNASWYTGKTLIEALDSSEPAKRNIGKPLRLTIGDVFRGGITNPLSISGRIDAGAVQIADSILAMPSNETATVKAIEIENEPVDWAVAGQIPTLHLTDIDPIHLRLGDIVCDPNDPVKLIKSFSCKILAFEHVMPMSVDVFRGRLQAEGKIKELVAVLGKGKGEVVKKKPKIIKPAEAARVVIELSRELPLEAGVRVVLREGGSTVAAGLIEE
ncbi:hypothetical protein CC78DRAFT_622251 [Lojkania enalia]|uniref:Elongation factor 1 alpha-like protein n=1 Tax=Lojkania enalia TaxID=147567 RepID=A0A9P4K0G6_9PLEO|nr:hypothetical protein CC78DRAFT_622251 [Didymosphaeria enalia]